MIDSLLLDNLIGGGWKDLHFAPFHPGVSIHPLYGDGDGPAAAILRYDRKARVPYHEHTGFEHVLVLDGMQEDERGTYAKGSLTINPPGTSHDVWSEDGCVALLIWERPVKIIARP